MLAGRIFEDDVLAFTQDTYLSSAGTYDDCVAACAGQVHGGLWQEKVYQEVKVSGVPTEESLGQLRRGIMIDRGRLNEIRSGRRDRVITSPAKVEMVRGGDNPWFELTLTEGRNRQIRKMFEVVGHRVEKIKRVTYGPLQLDVEAGKYRALTLREVALLKASVRKKQPRQPAD